MSEERPLEVHKPKPWRGVRGFLKEYVIIVVGVLTALGAEQAAEAVHTHNEVAEARAALNKELAGNAVQVGLVEVEEVCIPVQLDNYVRWAEGGARSCALPVKRK